MKTNAKKEQKKKILIAEDDVFLAGLYQAKFTKEGFEVLMAENGAEALSLARKNMPDLILMDLIMPTKNGFEALKEFKEDQELKKIKIIILSNLSQEEDKKRVLEMGATDYAVKANVSFREVLTLAKKHLGLK